MNISRVQIDTMKQVKAEIKDVRNDEYFSQVCLGMQSVQSSVLSPGLGRVLINAQCAIFRSSHGYHYLLQANFYFYHFP